MTTKLFLSNLPDSITRQGLLDLFRQWQVLDRNISLIQNGGPKPPFAFVVMKSDVAAREAIAALNQTKYQGNRITVRIAEDRPKAKVPMPHPVIPKSPVAPTLQPSTIPLKLSAISAASMISVLPDRPVYLCDTSALGLSASIPPAVGLISQEDRLLHLSHTLPTPWATAVDAYIGLLKNPPQRLPAQAIQDVLELVVRFFTWTFYSTLDSQKVTLSKDLIQRLSGAKGYGSLTRNTFGECLGITDVLGLELQRARIVAATNNQQFLSDPQFLATGLSWWHAARPVLGKLLSIRNREVHSISSIGKNELSDTLVSLTKHFINLQSLPWALVSSDQDSIILRGSSSTDWMPMTSNPEPIGLRLDPLMLFWPRENGLDVFHEVRNLKPVFYRLGKKLGASGKFPSVMADVAIARRLQDHCPVDSWKTSSEREDKWKDRSKSDWDNKKYNFTDLEGLFPKHLHGREDALGEVQKQIVDGLQRGTKALILQGNQGIGKSALMWHLSRPHVKDWTVVSYFFRESDSKRCQITSFFEAASITISRSIDVALDMVGSEQELFQEAVNAFEHCAITNQSRKLVFLLDGLDELKTARASDLTTLLQIIAKTRPGTFWVCSSLPMLELETFVTTGNDAIHSMPIVELPLDARRTLVRERLSTIDSQLSPAERLIVGELDWTEKIISNSDAGLPLYLEAVVTADYIREGKVPDTLKEIWSRTLLRLDERPRGVAALLAVALQPLRPIDIVEIFKMLNLENVTEILRFGPFRREVEGWTLAPAALRQHVRQSGDVRITDAIFAATRDLMSWVRSTWQNSTSEYPLKWFPRHLADSSQISDHQELRSLARNSEFRNLQGEYSPDLPVETLSQALKTAARDGELMETFSLALEHAKLVTHLGRLREMATNFMAGGYFRVSQLAKSLEDRRDQRHWELLAAIGALTAGDPDSAKNIISKIVLPSSRRTRDDDAFTPILLSLLASVAAKTDVDITPFMTRATAVILGPNSRRRFVESLSHATETSLFLDLLPNDKTRRYGLEVLARALARVGKVEAIIDLIKAEHESFENDLRLEAALGYAEFDDFIRASQFASRISGFPRRCEAFCALAVEAATRGKSASQILSLLKKIQRGVDAANGTPRDLIENVVESIQNFQPVRRVGITAMLGVVQHRMSLSGDSLLDQSEKMLESLADSQTIGEAAFRVAQAFMRLEQWDDARRMAGLIKNRGFQTVALTEIRASEMTASFGDSAPVGLGAPYIASALLRAGQFGKTTEVLLEGLVLSRPKTADEPDRWGEPRVIGAAAAALFDLGQRETAEELFSLVERALKKLTKGWELHRAWGLIDLAQARLSLVDLDQGPTAGILANAGYIVTRSEKLKTKPIASEILAEIWALMKMGNLGDANVVLNNALQIARECRKSIQQVEGLVEIARRQVRVEGTDAAVQTIGEAQSLVTGENEAVRAVFMKGRAQCGFLDGLEAEIAEAKRQFTGKERDIVCRAEVERLLKLGDFDAAEAALGDFTDPEDRSLACRSIAEEEAARGNYDTALRLVRDKIDESRGELVPDIVRAVAKHARKFGECRPDARIILFDFFSETARHLDGTYRVISSVIESRAFPELDTTLLLNLTKSFGVVGNQLWDRGLEKTP